MDSKITLKQQFESMNTGDVMLTKANRATIFVNAKRAKITVSTKTLEDQTQVTKTGELKAIKAPLANGKDAVIRAVFNLSTADRLKVFEAFELCCGNNRGSCICEAETLEPIQTPIDTRKDVLNALQAKIDGITDTPKQIVVDDNWIEMPTTIENGETLYWHRKIKGSPVCYKRETNWDTFA